MSSAFNAQCICHSMLSHDSDSLNIVDETLDRGKAPMIVSFSKITKTLQVQVYFLIQDLIVKSSASTDMGLSSHE